MASLRLLDRNQDAGARRLAILVLFGSGFARQVMAVLVSIMFLTSLWLLYLQAFVIHHFCQYCLLSAGVTTLLTITLFAARIAKRRAPAS